MNSLRGTRRAKQSIKFACTVILLLSGVLLTDTRAIAQSFSLKCFDSDNLYADPYDVFIDIKSSNIGIVGHSPVSLTNKLEYSISHIEKDNGYIISADGKLLNSHIVIQINDSASIQYTDAFTDRPLATDKCQPTSNAGKTR